jgi:hypothetical protein
MNLKELFNKENLRQKLAWVTRNVVVLLLAANLVMSFMIYWKANEASEYASGAEYTAEQAHSAAEDASEQAREAAEAARDAANSAERVASEVLLMSR